ncbi:nucleotide disphospho-sugar-binding domain-containing protein [Actinopolyspora mortivallis]|uniref:C-glycosyltransferase SaqGT5 n=1 Tax=Actinopolyspora mortivallis TaxID=33906 RepID=A0A2T0GT47_ACTMO|nr:nucleotide disphospho-sugar-binding domain-containing protein [Actinopolyspora mortivallis]PRW62267.1 C-glycosyltransferase SaqGT5 [Actinopolyspora mortivallis]
MFALAPLATAVRNAGHQVFMAATEETVPTIAQVNLPAISLTDRSLHSLISEDRNGNPVALPSGLEESQRHCGEWFGRLAAASLDALFELTNEWRPDVVVGGKLSYAAALIARTLNVPYVRHAWDFDDYVGIDPHASRELRPELDGLGLDDLPTPDLFIDISPSDLAVRHATEIQPMRWIPGNKQGKVLPWMYIPTSGRRVCITSGNRVSVMQSHDFICEVAESLAEEDIEVVIAAPEDAAPELRRRLPGLNIGWLPLDVVAPTCDAVVHHGGGVTSLTALNAGVPQVVFPGSSIQEESSERLARTGAALTLTRSEATPELIAKSCWSVLEDPEYKRRSVQLARDIAEFPTPDLIVRTLERL